MFKKLSMARARLRHAMALYNCKQGHGWIEHNYIYKTSLLNITKISMDLSVATWIHSNKITAVTDLVKLNIMLTFYQEHFIAKVDQD